MQASPTSVLSVVEEVFAALRLLREAAAHAQQFAQSSAGDDDADHTISPALRSAVTSIQSMFDQWQSCRRLCHLFAPPGSGAQLGRAASERLLRAEGRVHALAFQATEGENFHHGSIEALHKHIVWIWELVGYEAGLRGAAFSSVKAGCSMLACVRFVWHEMLTACLPRHGDPQCEPFRLALRKLFVGNDCLLGQRSPSAWQAPAGEELVESVDKLAHLTARLTARPDPPRETDTLHSLEAFGFTFLELLVNWMMRWLAGPELGWSAGAALQSASGAALLLRAGSDNTPINSRRWNSGVADRIGKIHLDWSAVVVLTQLTPAPLEQQPASEELCRAVGELVVGARKVVPLMPALIEKIYEGGKTRATIVRDLEHQSSRCLDLFLRDGELDRGALTLVDAADRASVADCAIALGVALLEANPLVHRVDSKKMVGSWRQLNEVRDDWLGERLALLNTFSPAQLEKPAQPHAVRQTMDLTFAIRDFVKNGAGLKLFEMKSDSIYHLLRTAASSPPPPAAESDLARFSPAHRRSRRVAVLTEQI